MRQWHEVLLGAVAEERARLASRRAVLGGGAKAAGLGAPAIAVAGMPRLARAQDATPVIDVEQDFEDDIDVLNYALTLENLEFAFYRDGLALGFDLGTDPFGVAVADRFAEIRDHEGAHVAALTQTITDLGGTPVTEQVYNFTDAYATAEAFFETAQALENTGVAAYDGAGAAISDPALLTVAGQIVAVEAEHAAYLNVLNGDPPAPAPFETPLSRDEVLEIAAPFLGAAAGTPAADEGAVDEGAEEEATPDS